MANRMNGKNPIKNIGVGRNGNLTPGNPGNSGGKPGRSGRKPIAFVEQCEALVDSVVLARVGQYMRDKKHTPSDPAWRWCAEYVTKYTKAEPPRSMALSGPGGGAIPMDFTFDLGKAGAARIAGDA